MTNIKNRRKAKTPSQKALYREKALAEKLKTERRADELARMGEVLAQRRLWWRVLVACLLVNGVFVALGLWGLYR